MPSSAATALNLHPPADLGSMDQRHELTDAINLLADLTEAFTAALFLRERGGEYLKAASWHTLSR